jgi:hypothetical protein
MGDRERERPPARHLTGELVREAARAGWIEIIGASMEPLLPLGSEVRLRPLEGRPPRGALVLFPYRDDLAVHRVVGRSGERVRTKGDRAVRSDPGLREAGELIGIVVAARHSGREASLESRSWRAAGALVALHSRGWDLAVTPLPRPFLERGGGLAGRIFRKLLRMGNSAFPRLVSWLLRPTWAEREAGA